MNNALCKLLTFILLLTGFLTVSPSAALAQSAKQLSTVPTELKPWVGWVRAQHADLDCATKNGFKQCLWPGELSLEVDENGGSFSLRLRSDKRMAVPLPHTDTAWPTKVEVSGKRVTVLEQKTGAKAPIITIDAGSHLSLIHI